MRFTACCLVIVLSACSGSPVSLPANAPLSREQCGWPATTELAFAGWSTLEKLGFGDPADVPSNGKQVFAMVSSRPISEATEVTRRYCLRSIDGTIQRGTVTDEWQPPSDPAP